MALPLLTAGDGGPRLHGAGPAALDPHREGRAARLHVTREYAIDPLEILFVREVTDTGVEREPDHVAPRWRDGRRPVARPDEPLRAASIAWPRTGTDPSSRSSTGRRQRGAVGRGS